MTEPTTRRPAAALKPVNPLDKFENAEGTGTFLGTIREWADALVIAFVLAMFIRMFVVELFKIPSGSMSPTLLGDLVAEGRVPDSTGIERDYLLIKDRFKPEVQVFSKSPDDKFYAYEGRRNNRELTASQDVLLRRNLKLEEHRILVNKFAYWFNLPDRGDIVIFRVPFKNPPDAYERNGETMQLQPYVRNQSTYVKRLVAFEGERVEVRPDQHLYVNGQIPEEPEVLSYIQYTPGGHSNVYDVIVPDNHVLVFGDNSDNSADSRFWGPLPVENLRGKAVLRYWPLKKFRFLN